MSQPAPFTHLSVVNDKEANFEIKNTREKIYNVDATLIFFDSVTSKTRKFILSEKHIFDGTLRL